MRRAPVIALFVALLALVAGCASLMPPAPDAEGATPASAPRTGSTAASRAVPPELPVPSATATALPADTPTPATPSSPAVATPSPTAPAGDTSPSPVGQRESLRRGMQGADVLALQHRLSALGFWLGTADGGYGYLTEQAVLAFEKSAGLHRDGVAGPGILAALESAQKPTAQSSTGHVVEVDLAHQILLVVDNGVVSTVFNTSTGSGRHYYYQGRRYLATTPAGHFQITREIDGLRDGPLGALWRPKYFNGGIAVHGSSSVPAYPASHGCVRVSNSAINWIWSSGLAPVGTAVWVYGG